MITSITVEPEVSFLDTPVVVDNRSGEVQVN